MERIGLISNDPRLKSELEKWLDEIPGEFELTAVGPPATGDPPTPNPETTTPEPAYRLIIFDSGSGFELLKIRTELGLLEIPWLAIEHDEFPATSILTKGADDIVAAPLDRPVFLQKIEYLIAGAAKITPSFLFMAKVDFPIELAKTVHITHISETGCTILAPRPLARGVEGTLMSKIFGDGDLRRVEIRVVDTNPIFETALASTSPQDRASEPRFEVRLRFFGLRLKQLQSLRRWLGDHTHVFPEIPRSNGAPKTNLHVTLLSPQPALRSTLSSALEDLAKVEVISHSGFQRLQKSLLDHASRSNPKSAVAAHTAGDPASSDFVGPRTRAQSIPLFPTEKTVLHLRLANEATAGGIERILPAPKKGETVLAQTAETLAQDANLVTKFIDAHDREAFNEGTAWVLANSDLTKGSRPEVELELTFENPGLRRSATRVLISLMEAATPARTALLKVEIEERSDLQASGASSSHALPPCEAFLIDASLLHFDAKDKITKLTEWCETFDLKNSFGNRPPIVVVNASETSFDPTSLRGTRVRQLIFDFSDRRYQAELFISLSRPELWTSPGLSVVGLKTDLEAHLARPAKALGVSEVSLMIENRTPFKKGTELLVLSPLWPGAPEGLRAKFRASTQKEGGFENEFVLLGVKDLVQKEIRKYTRDDYIKKKAQGQG